MIFTPCFADRAFRRGRRQGMSSISRSLVSPSIYAELPVVARRLSPERAGMQTIVPDKIRSAVIYLYELKLAECHQFVKLFLDSTIHLPRRAVATDTGDSSRSPRLLSERGSGEAEFFRPDGTGLGWRAQRADRPELTAELLG